MVSRQTEKGQKITDFTNTASTSGSLTSFSDISVGTADGQRIKHAVTIKSLHLNMFATNADPTNVMRVIVFQYFESPSLPALSDILQSTTASLSWHSPYNFDNAKSYRILYDSTKLINSVAKPQVHWNKFIKLSKARKNIEYSGTTTDGMNKIYMYVLSDSAAISHPPYYGTATLTYTDM